MFDPLDNGYFTKDQKKAIRLAITVYRKAVLQEQYETQEWGDKNTANKRKKLENLIFKIAPE